MSITVEALVTRVERRLHMVAGVAVQVYAEDVILHSIQTAFDRLFKHRFWSHYTHWDTWTLDGTTGQVTTDVSGLTYPLREFTDIRNIFYDEEERPLPRWPQYRNPVNITGTKARYWEPLAQAPTKVFRILPITAAGDLQVRYRSKPAEFEASDTLYLDSLLLELAAALDYLVSDGSNPAFINQVSSMLTRHFETVDAEQDDDEIELVRGLETIPNEWY